MQLYKVVSTVILSLYSFQDRHHLGLQIPLRNNTLCCLLRLALAGFIPSNHCIFSCLMQLKNREQVYRMLLFQSPNIHSFILRWLRLLLISWKSSLVYKSQRWNRRKCRWTSIDRRLKSFNGICNLRAKAHTMLHTVSGEIACCPDIYEPRPVFVYLSFLMLSLSLT